MGELGRKLKEAREGMGLSLRDVEEATKIRKKYLQALENENFEEIPGRTYAKGFVKNYSNFLQLDTKDLLDEFDSLVVNFFKDKELSPASDTARSSSSVREGKLFRYGLILAAILLLFIGNGIYKSLSDNPVPNTPPETNNTGNQQEPPVSNTPEEPNQPEVQPENEPPVQVEGVNLVIEIVKDQCWLSVISDGSQVFSGTLNEGDKREFEGENEIVVTLGNAGAAKVTYNGEVLEPLGGEGEVVTPPPFVSKQPQG